MTSGRCWWRSGRPGRDGWRNRWHHQFDSGGSAESCHPDADPRIIWRHSGFWSGRLSRTIRRWRRQARIQGTVILQAQISKDGNIENLHLISGHPMLAPAAIEAVKQWKYKPYLLNGEPVEVETQVQVNFTLAGG